MMRRSSKWLPKLKQITLSKPGMWSLSSRLTAFKLSFLKWWWMISLSHWWRGRSKAVSLSEQTWSSSSSSTTPRCSIAKKTIEPVLWNKSHWLISLFVFQYYFFAKSDLDFSIDFFFVFVLYLSNYSFAKYYVLSNHNNFGQGRGGRAGISKNVTNAGSQLTRGGGAGQE